MRLTTTFLTLLFLPFSLLAVETQAAKIYLVDIAKSSVNWKGSKVAGEHAGVIALNSARLNFENSVLNSGEFVVDMTSIKNTDIEKLEDRTKLEKHLKSQDFFATEEFPQSTFKFDSVKDMGNGQYAITGQMTIKQKTNEETFVAKVNQADNKLVAVADLKIDRTKYGIMYKASKTDEDEWFFTKWFKGGKDKLIDNTLEIRLNIVADRKLVEESSVQ